MSTATATRYTPDDLLTMPDGDRYELVNGQLVEKPVSAKSDWVGGKLLLCLGNYVESIRAGVVFPETGYRCFPDDPDRLRKPDGSFIAADRLHPGDIPDGYIRIAPDLAFEVISPNDTYYEVEAKVREYLDAGVRLVWVLDPDRRTIRVYDGAAGLTSDLTAADNLTGGAVLPGFRCAVADLFPPIAS